MTNRKKKLGFIVAFITIIILILSVCFGWWAWKYYRLPDVPDDNDYKTVDERASAALAFVKSHNMSENYALFVDYAVPSGTPRLYVWDFNTKKIVARTYVMHGPGMGSTAEKPVFSNKPGSNCSALGRFLITRQHGNINKSGYMLKGLDTDNQSAYYRGLMIHRSTFLDGHVWMKYIPLNSNSCQGCVTVTSRGLDYIAKLVKKEEKPILLWNYCSQP